MGIFGLTIQGMCIRVYIYMYRCACMYACMHARMYMYLCICIHVFMGCVCSNAHVYYLLCLKFVCVPGIDKERERERERETCELEGHSPGKGCLPFVHLDCLDSCQISGSGTPRRGFRVEWKVEVVCWGKASVRDTGRVRQVRLGWG